jgi:hypothetical protein
MVDAVSTALVALLVTVSAGAAAAGVVDPTEPPPGYRAARTGDDKSQEASAAPEAVEVQMIARNGDERIAVVNGRRVRVGEAVQLDGKRVAVVAISDDSVVLARDGRRQTFELMPRTGIKLVCAAQPSDRPECRNDAPGGRR